MLHKSPRIESKKLRDSARNQECTLNVAGVCNYDSATTVLCHLPSEDKGMAKKSHDYFAAFGCSACHTWLDGNQGDEVDRLFYWLRGVKRTLEIWIREGLVVIKGHKP